MRTSKAEQDNLVLEIVPDVGIKPILFGMKHDGVRKVLGQEPNGVYNYPGAATKLEEHYREFIGVHYNVNDEVYSVVVAPGTITVWFQGVQVIGPHVVDNPLRAFLSVDPNPLENVGFIHFDKIGVAATGYHDNDESQRAITVYRKGSWKLTNAKPISLEALIGKNLS